MRKKFLLILAGVMLSGILSWLGYRFYQHKQINPVWQLIPAEALAVIQVPQTAEIFNNWQQIPAWQDFAEASDLKKLLADLQILTKQTPELQDFLQKNPVFVSLHATAHHRFEYLFILPLPDKNLLGLIQKYFNQNQTFQSQIRVFQDLPITTVSEKKIAGKTFAYTIHNDFLIGSFSPLLVEDAIRTIKKGSFLTKNTWEEKDFFGEKKQVKIYLNVTGFKNFVKLYEKENPFSLSEILENTFLSSQFNIEVLANQLVLFGNTKTEAVSEKTYNFLNIFENQQAHALVSSKLIPENTALLYQMAFSDGKSWWTHLQKFQAFHRFNDAELSQEFSKKYKIDFNPSAFWIDNEIVIGRLASNDTENNRFLIVHTRDGGKALSFLKNIAKSIDLQDNHNPYTESYAGLYLHKINTKDFPALWFGSLASGFEQCFYTEKDNFLIVASNLSSLKSIIDGNQSGNNWQQAESKQKMLAKLGAQSHFSIFLNTPEAWTFANENFHEDWHEKLGSKAGLWKNFSQVVLQTTLTSKQEAQTHLVAFHQKSATAQHVLHKIFPVWSATLDTNAASATYLLKNQRDDNWQILVQDKANKLYALDKNGKRLWQHTLPQSLSSDIYEINPLKNGKNQALLALSKQLFLYTAKGENVVNFPLQVPASSDLKHLAVFDYERKQDYRFLLTDQSGDLWMYNKAGKLLEGWKPKHTGYRLQGTPKHLRVADKDYIVALQQNGLVQVWNRKGQSVKGFPVKTDQRLQPDFFVQAGAGLAESLISVISDDGLILEINFNGEVANRKQMIKNSKEDIFRLCLEKNGKDWFIVRQSLKEITVLDESGNEKFEKPLENISLNTIVQYYDFGADTKIFVMTQPDLKKSFLFNGEGKVIGEGFDNQAAVSVLYVSDLQKLLIYKTMNRTAGMVSVKIK
ncbi:MAG: hypothetical protein H7Y04_04095 [Verrucomicrobia bacterium]|nr:hypothetical protein [Cytophagales bacterium]